MALVDQLAAQLSEHTGNKFEILRARVPIPGNPTARGPMRYGLRATRDGHDHTFNGGRGYTLQELTRWLASILDMYHMGFLTNPNLEPKTHGSGYISRFLFSVQSDRRLDHTGMGAAIDAAIDHLQEVVAEYPDEDGNVRIC
jgi:hypothetical protein